MAYQKPDLPNYSLARQMRPEVPIPRFFVPSSSTTLEPQFPHQRTTSSCGRAVGSSGCSCTKQKSCMIFKVPGSQVCRVLGRERSQNLGSDRGDSQHAGLRWSPVSFDSLLLLPQSPPSSCFSSLPHNGTSPTVGAAGETVPVLYSQ